MTDSKERYPRNISLGVDAFIRDRNDTEGVKRLVNFLHCDEAKARISSLFVPELVSLDFHTMDLLKSLVAGNHPDYSLVSDLNISGSPHSMTATVLQAHDLTAPKSMYVTFARGTTRTAIQSVIKQTKKLEAVQFLLSGVLPEDCETDIKYEHKVSPDDFMEFTVEKAHQLGLSGVVASAEFEEAAKLAKDLGIEYFGCGVNLDGEEYRVHEDITKRATSYKSASQYCSSLVVGSFIAYHPDGSEAGLTALSA